MTTFLRTFTHVGFYGEKTEGALVDDNGTTLFIHVHGWYPVKADYVYHHDTKLEDLESDYSGLYPHNHKLLAKMDKR